MNLALACEVIFNLQREDEVRVSIINSDAATVQ